MRTNLHLGLTSNCDAAFAFYEDVFHTKRLMTMRWRDAPAGMTCPEGAEQLVMHTALSLGGLTLMGADAPPGHGKAFGGFDISVDDEDEAEVKRLFASLSEGGSVMMPLSPTFWSPLFGMCTDKFGVNWMLSMPGRKHRMTGRFDSASLYEAMNAQRRARGQSWMQVGAELGISPSTLTRTRLGGRMEVDGMLAMVRWVGRSVESFTFGYPNQDASDSEKKGQP